MFGSQSTCAHNYLVGRKRTKLFERFLSLVIAAALSLSLMPHSAWAGGGYGEEDSSAAGPVVRPGSVELYRVEASGSPRVGSILTATVSAGGISSSGGPDTTIEKTFVLTVKGDPEKVAAAKADLESKVQANFTYENIGLSETDDAVDWNAVTGELTLPRPEIIGVDGKYYEVTYSTSNDAVEVNGWAGRVYRPLPGDSPVSVGVTATVTDKSNS